MMTGQADTMTCCIWLLFSHDYTYSHLHARVSTEQAADLSSNHVNTFFQVISSSLAIFDNFGLTTHESWVGPFDLDSASDLRLCIGQTLNALSYPIRATETKIARPVLHFFLVGRKQISANDARAWATTISCTDVPREFLVRHLFFW